MKQYRFDYIRENVEKWNPDIPRTFEHIDFLPYYVVLPWISLENVDGELKLSVTPARDYYGEDITDMSEWHKQRTEYIKNLVKEYETLSNKGTQRD